MSADRITAVVATLAGAAPATCDRVTLCELACRARQVRAWLDAFDASLSVRAAELDEPAQAVLAGDGRRSARDVRAAAERGTICVLMPALHAALARGSVSAGHVDALARTAARLDDTARADLVSLSDAVVADAEQSSVEAFERHVADLERRLTRDDGVQAQEQMRRQRCLRRWLDQRTGMVHTHLALDPLADAAISAALDHAVAGARAANADESRTAEQVAADAFVELITRPAGAGGPPSGEVAVLIDYDTLCHGRHDHSVCETADGHPIPPASVRRLMCEAAIIPIVLSGDGVTLDEGRAMRVASRTQRRALRAMYRTCGHPGCTVRFADCQIHHVIAWDRSRGPTDLANLLPLCGRHHHLVHEGGWDLTLHADRTITLCRPDHSVAYHGTSITVAPTGTHTPPPATADDEGDDLAAKLAQAVAAHTNQ